MVMPSLASSTMVSSTSFTISGSSAEVGSSNSMMFGFMHSARAIATRCCWPPDRRAGYLCGLLRYFHAREIIHRQRLGFLLRHAPHPDRRQRAVLQHGEMRKQIELLKHHADVAAHREDVFGIVGQFDAVDDDAAALPVLQPVDAAQQRRFAAAGRAADDDALAARDLQIDVAQHVKFAVPFVQADDLDRHVGQRRRLHSAGPHALPSDPLTAGRRAPAAFPRRARSATCHSSR